tara:strand:+ start:5143 stop:5319 length:177 start_codon:yes stop_codon:yes gene_type:complete
MTKTLKPSTVIDTISLKIELKKQLREFKRQGESKKAQIVQLKIDQLEDKLHSSPLSKI